MARLGWAAAEVRLPKGTWGLRLFSFVTYMRRTQTKSSNHRPTTLSLPVWLHLAAWKTRQNNMYILHISVSKLIRAAYCWQRCDKGVCVWQREKIPDKEKVVCYMKPCCCPQLGVFSSAVIRNGETLHSEQVNAISMPKRCILGKTRAREQLRKVFSPLLSGFLYSVCCKTYGNCHWDEWES